MGKRWIVLVNKTPRGPLSTEEITTLLGQNLIRRNDLAYEVPDDPSSGTAEWKFLWQFDDFDRRKDEKLPSDPALLTEAQRNRRATPSERQIKAEVQAALPDEFATIQPEELVLRAKPGNQGLEKDLNEEVEEEFLHPTAPASGGSNNTWLILMVVVFLGGAGAVLMTKGKKEPGRDGASKGIEMELPVHQLAGNQPEPPPPPPPTANKQPAQKMVTSVLAREAPKPPEKGEVSLEDYRKQREEKLEKERVEEEERRKAELKAQEEEADEEGLEEGAARPKRKVKKRKPTAAEIDDGLERTDRLDRDPDAELEPGQISE